MKITGVSINNRKKVFQVLTKKDTFEFPFSQLKVPPTKTNPLVHVYVDQELGSEGFSYVLKAGQTDTVHIDHVLRYNQEPDFVREEILYKLTLKAQELIELKAIKKRELIRKLGTSPTQFYRLIDQTFYGKTIDQMVRLIFALGSKVDVLVKKVA